MDFKQSLVATTITATLITSLPVLAQQRYEYELGINHFTTETSSGTESTQTSPFASFYFRPVNTHNKPLAEAAFLDRTGFTTIAFSQGEDRSDDTLGLTLLLDIRSHDRDTTFQLGHSNLDSNGGNIEVKSYKIGLGHYISNNQHVGIEYNNTNNGSLNDLRSYNIGIKTKTVRSLTGDSAFKLIAGIKRMATQLDDINDTNMSYAFDADFYPNPSSNLGAGIEINRGDDIFEEGTTLSVKAGYFILPTIEITASFSRFLPSYTSVEEEQKLRIGIRGRF